MNATRLFLLGFFTKNSSKQYTVYFLDTREKQETCLKIYSIYANHYFLKEKSSGQFFKVLKNDSFCSKKSVCIYLNGVYFVRKYVVKKPTMATDFLEKTLVLVCVDIKIFQLSV